MAGTAQRPLTLGEIGPRYETYMRNSEGAAPGTVEVCMQTFRKIRRRLGDDFPLKEFDSIAVSDVLEFVNGGDPDSVAAPRPATLRTIRYGIRAFILYLVHMKYIPNAVEPSEPLRRQAKKATYRVKAPDRHRVYREDFPRLLDAAEGVNPVARATVAIGLYLLLRESEIKTLRWGDLDLAHGRITVTIHKKGKEVVVMPVSAELERELRRYKTWYAQQIRDVYGEIKPEHYIIPRRRRRVMDNSGPGRGGVPRERLIDSLHPDLPNPHPADLVKRALVAIDFEMRNPETGESNREGCHTLRRSGALAMFDHMIEQGKVRDGVLRHVMAMLNHSNTSMTERYLGMNVDREKLDDLIRGKMMYGSDPAVDTNVVPLIRKAAGDGSDHAEG